MLQEGDCILSYDPELDRCGCGLPKEYGVGLIPHLMYFGILQFEGP